MVGGRGCRAGLQDTKIPPSPPLPSLCSLSLLARSLVLSLSFLFEALLPLSLSPLSPPPLSFSSPPPPPPLPSPLSPLPPPDRSYARLGFWGGAARPTFHQKKKWSGGGDAERDSKTLIPPLPSPPLPSPPFALSPFSLARSLALLSLFFFEAALLPLPLPSLPSPPFFLFSPSPSPSPLSPPPPPGPILRATWLLGGRGATNLPHPLASGAVRHPVPPPQPSLPSLSLFLELPPHLSPYPWSDKPSFSLLPSPPSFPFRFPLDFFFFTFPLVRSYATVDPPYALIRLNLNQSRRQSNRARARRPPLCGGRPRRSQTAEFGKRNRARRIRSDTTKASDRPFKLHLVRFVSP